MHGRLVSIWQAVLENLVVDLQFIFAGAILASSMSCPAKEEFDERRVYRYSVGTGNIKS